MSNRILLVGNGINDAQKIEWTSLLEHVQSSLLEEKDRININSGTSFTLLFDSICRKSSKIDAEKEARLLVKDYIESKSNFVAKLWQRYDIILTTNFDNNLFINLTDFFAEKTRKILNKNAPLKSRINFTYNKRKKTLHHIHGFYKIPESICLGFYQYTKNLQKLQSYILSNYSEEEFLSEKTNKSKNETWVKYFFEDNTTIDILGLNLSSEEIDLWWILNHRSKFFKYLKNNNINYFDLNSNSSKLLEEQIKKLTDKKSLFNSMNINFHEINSQTYNSDFYSACLEQIPEIKSQQ